MADNKTDVKKGSSDNIQKDPQKEQRKKDRSGRFDFARAVPWLYVFDFRRLK